MLQYIRQALRHSRSDLGVTAVEYALMVAAIAVVVAVAAFTLGGAASSKLTNSANCISGATASTASTVCNP